MVRPRIKTIIKNFNKIKFVSYEYKGIKFNTKGEVMDAIRRGKFGRRLYLKYK